MTTAELNQLYWLNREIEIDQRNLDNLQRANGSPEEIAGLQAIILRKQERCIRERARLERYIADIPDSLARMIFHLRFVDGLPWQQVAASIGGNNTADSVRKICTRFLERQ
ncbi:MAG: hypothetical protein LUD78_13085 [Clostridiales bacterium]|nr:hypothetical protein [Clostridiales bacterium]